MILLRNNKIQKLSACFFLAVFVFINGIKTFHKHEFTYSIQKEATNKNANTVKTNFFCVICDFHFLKDSDAHLSIPIIATSINYVATFYSYIISSSTAVAVTTSVRGPPVSVA